MKKLLSRSFRNRLFAAFLAASLLPLLLCSSLLLQIFRLRMTDDARENASAQLAEVSQTLDGACVGFLQTAASVQEIPVLMAALTGDGEADGAALYSAFLDATRLSRDTARLDLYDAQGIWHTSTRSAPGSASLPTNWGVLYAAARQGSLAFYPPENPDSATAPLLQGAIPLRKAGTLSGYLLISLSQADLNRLLDGALGTQGDLLLVSSYWRPVYCSQPALVSSLTASLRARLLDGQPLSGGPEEYRYTVIHHDQTGLYAILRQPQVFTQETMNLLYTVSLSIALICVAVSVLLSLTLSRQMYHPIQRLRKAFGEVGHNNLDVYVPHERDDELGQLAERFNGMVIALKHNQEQLVENQRELNEAQIRMLQAQLNPHFLCNTLDTMKWISKINKVPQVALMSTNLADILRFCVAPDEFVPLARELEILRSYVEIQRIRLSDAFSFSAEVPPELEDCLVPKMILQPIVENAILHGLEGMTNGAVQVRAEARGPVLSILVQDNGRGFPPELEGPYARRDRELSRGHLGLYNVDTILRKHYGDAFGLFLSRRPDGDGALVTAMLPLRRKEDTLC